MHEALALAQQAVGLSDPNPRVGCVIIAADGRVIGRGHTQQAGGPHAEVMALRDAAASGGAVRGAHRLRQPRALLPPRPHAAVLRRADRRRPGARRRGAATTRTRSSPARASRGCAPRASRSSVGLLADEARELNIGFFSRMERGRPWVRLKVAVSLDGRTALDNGASQWITGEAARTDGHAWRKRAGAVLTGVGTVHRRRPAARRAAGRDGPPAAARGRRFAARPCRRARASSTPRAPCSSMPQTPAAERVAALQARGAEVALLPGRRRQGRPARDARRPRPGAASTNCTSRPGSKLNGSFVREGLVDEWLVYMAPQAARQRARLAAFGPLQTLADAVALRFHAVDRVGDDLRLLLRPAGASVALTLRQSAPCSPASSPASARSSTRRPWARDASYGKRLTLQAPAGYLDDAQPGDSIALNGACMTVTTFDAAARPLHDRHLGREPGQDRRPRPSPAPSTSRRRCARTTASAATSSAAMSTASAA